MVELRLGSQSRILVCLISLVLLSVLAMGCCSSRMQIEKIAVGIVHVADKTFAKEWGPAVLKIDFASRQNLVSCEGHRSPYFSALLEPSSGVAGMKNRECTGEIFFDSFIFDNGEEGVSSHGIADVEKYHYFALMYLENLKHKARSINESADYDLAKEDYVLHCSVVVPRMFHPFGNMQSKEILVTKHDVAEALARFHQHQKVLDAGPLPHSRSTTTNDIVPNLSNDQE